MHDINWAKTVLVLSSRRKTSESEQHAAYRRFEDAGNTGPGAATDKHSYGLGRHAEPSRHTAADCTTYGCYRPLRPGRAAEAKGQRARYHWRVDIFFAQVVAAFAQALFDALYTVLDIAVYDVALVKSCKYDAGKGIDE